MLKATGNVGLIGQRSCFRIIGSEKNGGRDVCSSMGLRAFLCSVGGKKKWHRRD